MPDLTAIGAVLGSLKTATEIAKFIRESDVSIERAELKLKVADLIGALADVKLELVELQDSFAAKDQRIKCRIPDDCIDSKRYPLFIARSVLKELIESLQSPLGVKPC